MGPAAKSSFRILLLMVCVAGFAWQIWDQLLKFFGEKKTVAISYETKTTLRFPTFVFCNHEAYRKFANLGRTEAEYRADAFDVAVRFNGTTTTDFGEPGDSRADVTVVPTVYNGFCKMFHVGKAFPARQLIC